MDSPGNSLDSMNSVDSEWRGPWLCAVNKGRELHLTVGNEGHLPDSITPFCFYIWGASQHHGYQKDLDSQGCLRSQRIYTVFDLSWCCLRGHCGSGFKTTCETDKGWIRHGCCSTCTPSFSSSCQVRADCADSLGLQQIQNRWISYSID